ncbi:MAG TPA: YncE family protein [Candidatus Sulfotelmatobacter sp.]|nr:YncE family protein [Candidatus Sulfotelmatobacter sp.]
MTGRPYRNLGIGVALALWPIAASAQFLIVGTDEKLSWDDKGAAVIGAPGKDTVTIVDIKNPGAPRIVASLTLENSVIGPPVNLAVTPDNSLALVANSIHVVQDGGAWKNTPDTKVYVIDLKANPPAQIATVEVGKQPSGMAINRAGDLALVTNRAGNSISVLSIKGKEVKVTDTVDVGDSVTSVAITPDGKRAFATKALANKVAILAIDGGKVTYGKQDIGVGVFPYNIAIAGHGKVALTSDNGNAGSSDGSVDTVTVIDLTAKVPHGIDKIVVDEAPEGIAASPKGDLAVSILLNGSAGVAKDAWFAHPKGRFAVLKVAGTKVTRLGYVDAGKLPEGAAFSPDGNWLYVGNYVDKDLSIYKVSGTKVTPAGTLKLPGSPASLRTSAE